MLLLASLRELRPVSHNNIKTIKTSKKSLLRASIVVCPDPLHDRAMVYLRSICLWALIILVEVAHGILRTLLVAPHLGDLTSRQVAIPIACLINFTLTWLFVTRLRLSPRQALAVGLLWVLLTVAFEVGLGLALGLPAERIGQDYDPRRGGFMLFGLTALALTPWFALKMRAGAKGPGAPSRP